MRFINLFLDENTFKNYSHGRVKPPMIAKYKISSNVIKPNIINFLNF
jgi:hypothetical protein